MAPGTRHRHHGYGYGCMGNGRRGTDGDGGSGSAGMSIVGIDPVTIFYYVVVCLCPGSGCRVPVSLAPCFWVDGEGGLVLEPFIIVFREAFYPCK